MKEKWREQCAEANQNYLLFVETTCFHQRGREQSVCDKHLVGKGEIPNIFVSFFTYDCCKKKNASIAAFTRTKLNNNAYKPMGVQIRFVSGGRWNLNAVVAGKLATSIHSKVTFNVTA